MILPYRHIWLTLIKKLRQAEAYQLLSIMHMRRMELRYQYLNVRIQPI